MSGWRTAFVGDPMRFRLEQGRVVSGQDENIAWLRQLIALPADWSADLYPTSSFGLAKTVLAQPDSAAALAYRRDPEAAWAARIGVSDAPDFGDLLPRLADHDLVVGFEMPPGLRRALHAAGTRYLNVSIHPWRFLQDLLFGVTSNDLGIQARLPAWDASLLDSRIRRFRALLAKRRPAALAFPDDLPVLVGQTERDAILIRNGGFCDWPEHADRLSALLQDHPAVVFSEHPLRQSSHEIVEFLRHRLGKTVVTTDANGYGFVFRPAGTTPLITLSSSLGVEALAAGHPVEFLLGDPRQRQHLPEIEPAPMLAVGHDLMDATFWQNLAQPAGAAALPQPPFHLGDDYVRTTLESWSYRAWRDGLTGQHARKTVLPGPAAQSGQLRTLAFGLSDLPVGGAWPETVPGVTLDGARPLGAGEERVVELGQGAGGGWRGIGLHLPEGWGIWSSDWCSTFQLFVTEEAAAQGCELDIDLSLRLLEPLLAQCPVVRASAGDQAVVLPFRPSTGATRSARLRCRAHTPAVTLRVEVSRLGMPAAQAGNTDERRLGLAFTTLRLRCMPSGAMGGLPPAGVVVQDVEALERSTG